MVGPDPPQVVKVGISGVLPFSGKPNQPLVYSLGPGIELHRSHLLYDVLLSPPSWFQSMKAPHGVHTDNFDGFKPQNDSSHHPGKLPPCVQDNTLRIYVLSTHLHPLQDVLFSNVGIDFRQLESHVFQPTTCCSSNCYRLI